MKIHSHNIFTRKSECGKKGKTSSYAEEINCLDCLNLDRKEWKEQVAKFNYHPLTNAKNGLKRVEKRIKELKKKVQEKKQ